MWDVLKALGLTAFQLLLLVAVGWLAREAISKWLDGRAEQRKAEVQSLLDANLEAIKTDLSIKTESVKSDLATALETTKSALATNQAIMTKNLDAAFSVDTDLRSRRSDLYEKVWPMGKIVPGAPVNTHLTYGDLTKLSEDLNNWYFNEHGGLYFSWESLRDFNNLQDALYAALSRREPADKEVPSAKGSPEGRRLKHDDDYWKIFHAFSDFRAELCKDLETRARSVLDDETGTEWSPGSEPPASMRFIPEARDERHLYADRDE